jgi:soluble lytic murein transglycosylase-like protein
MTKKEKALAHRIHDLIEEKFQGDAIANAIVIAARKADIQVSLLCAILEQETEFKNVYGHDGVRNPIKSPPGGLLRVTRENYVVYLKHRRNNEGMQGVGPMQLTWWEFQDRADKLGGCWNPTINIEVGAQIIADLIKQHGKTAGIAAYNGSGSAAQAYARSVLSKARKWHGWLT